MYKKEVQNRTAAIDQKFQIQIFKIFQFQFQFCYSVLECLRFEISAELDHKVRCS